MLFNPGRTKPAANARLQADSETLLFRPGWGIKETMATNSKQIPKILCQNTTCCRLLPLVCVLYSLEAYAHLKNEGKKEKKERNKRMQSFRHPPGLISRRVGSSVCLGGR